MATKKTPGTTTRSRSKKAAGTPEIPVNETPVPSAASGGAAVVAAREKTPTTSNPGAHTSSAQPNFRHPAEMQEQIRRRAYQLFQQRGGQHGFDVEDWLKAEAEFKSR